MSKMLLRYRQPDVVLLILWRLCHIVGDVPGLLRCFRSLNIMYPPHSDPAGADQTQVCVQTASYCTPTPQLSSVKPLYFTSVALRIALPLSMPKLLKVLARERAANPLQPTSTGELLTSCMYLESFLSETSINLPMGLSAPATQLVLWTQTQGPYPVAGWWLQSGYLCSRQMFSLHQL